MRYTKKWTFKNSKLVFLLKILKRLLKGKGNIIFAHGTHMITAPSGGGKTLLSNYIIRTITERQGGFFWVNMDQYDAKITKIFDMTRLFDSGHQKYRLPIKDDYKRYSQGIIYDEFNASYNRRMNRTTEYNETFVPLIKSVVTHRHQGHPRIYVLGQMKQDTQLQEILQYKHIVFCSKGYRYWYYREQDRIISAPRHLKVLSYIKVGEDSNGNATYNMIAKQKIKVTIDLLETYNTHAFADMFNDLPEYNDKIKQ